MGFRERKDNHLQSGAGNRWPRGLVERALECCARSWRFESAQNPKSGKVMVTERERDKGKGKKVERTLKVNGGGTWWQDSETHS